MHGPLHIIEPTLVGDAGHCSSFVRSICAYAERPVEITIWAGKGYRSTDLPSLVRVIGHFFRRLRRWQSYFLYRALLRQPGRIFIATAGRTDLLLLDWASRGEIPCKKVSCFFHWLNLNVRKQEQLFRIARRQPGIALLAPTEFVAAQLRQCGFHDVQVVPYPITRSSMSDGEQAPLFRHILSAGAARADKGISHVFSFIEHLADIGEAIPVVVQTSPDHYDKCDDTTRKALEGLVALSYPALSFKSETLPMEEYYSLFQGAVCLQLYDQKDFSDRISGITLDAMSCGAPVVTLAGTWIAGVVERFSSGEILGKADPLATLAAVRRIIANYGYYQENARQAGKVLQTENSGEHLYRMLTA